MAILHFGHFVVYLNYFIPLHLVLLEVVGTVVVVHPLLFISVGLDCTFTLSRVTTIVVSDILSVIPFPFYPLVELHFPFDFDWQLGLQRVSQVPKDFIPQLDILMSIFHFRSECHQSVVIQFIYSITIHFQYFRFYNFQFILKCFLFLSPHINQCYSY